MVIFPKLALGEVMIFSPYLIKYLSTKNEKFMKKRYYYSKFMITGDCYPYLRLKAIHFKLTTLPSPLNQNDFPVGSKN